MVTGVVVSVVISLVTGDEVVVSGVISLVTADEVVARSFVGGGVSELSSKLIVSDDVNLGVSVCEGLVGVVVVNGSVVGGVVVGVLVS